MRSRVEALLGCLVPRRLDHRTFHSLLRAHPAPRVRAHRPAARTSSSTTPTTSKTLVKRVLKELGIDDARCTPGLGSGADQPGEEPDGGTASRSPAAGLTARATRRRGVSRATSAALCSSHARRLRRPAAEDGRAVRAEPRRFAPLTRAGSGSSWSTSIRTPTAPQYMLVQPAGRRPPEPVRGRRPRPVDLRLARRRHPATSWISSTTSPRRHRPARAELPLDAGHPRRRHPRSSATTSSRKDKRLWTDGRAAAKVHGASRPPTSGTRPSSWRVPRARPSRRTAGGDGRRALPHQRAVARPRRRPAARRRRLPDRRRRAASTNGRKSRTRSPT